MRLYQRSANAFHIGVWWFGTGSTAIRCAVLPLTGRAGGLGLKASITVGAEFGSRNKRIDKKFTGSMGAGIILLPFR